MSQSTKSDDTPKQKVGKDDEIKFRVSSGDKKRWMSLAESAKMPLAKLITNALQEYEKKLGEQESAKSELTILRKEMADNQKVLSDITQSMEKLLSQASKSNEIPNSLDSQILFEYIKGKGSEGFSFDEFTRSMDQKGKTSTTSALASLRGKTLIFYKKEANRWMVKP